MEKRFSPRFITNSKFVTPSKKKEPMRNNPIKKSQSKITYDEKTGEEIKWVMLYDYKNYEISNFGKIRSIDRESYNSANALCFYPSTEIAQRSTKKNPNLFVTISLGVENGIKIRKTIYIQRAVADHFVLKPIENSELYQFATHIDDTNVNDNSYHNIKWCTKEELTIKEQTTKLKNGTINYSSKILGYEA